MKKSKSWEHQYLDVLKAIHTDGSWKQTRQVDKRTGEPLQTRGISGAQIVVRPEESMPLLTLRPLRAALPMFIGEILWILAGDNTVDLVHKYGIPYWDEWATPDMLERNGLEPGTYGRMYGPQWRGFYGKAGEPFDQIKWLLWKLRNEPYDKRMIVMAYHPADCHRVMHEDGKPDRIASTMPVRPCHGNFQLQWDGGETIDMTHWQVSADVPLGIPSNLCMYRFLLEVLCRLTGYKVGTLTHVMCDAHYYSDQVEGVKIILNREPLPGPTVTISEKVVEAVRMIIDEGVREPLATGELNPFHLPYHEWIRQEVKIENYAPHPAIPRELLPVAV